MQAKLESKEYCSCYANVMGIKFYPGLSKLKSMMNVRLQREFGNIHDPCAIKVLLKSGEVLGHLEKSMLKYLHMSWMHVCPGSSSKRKRNNVE